VSGSDGARSGDALAVVPVRDGMVPLGGDEAVAEAGGRAVVIGSGTDVAADALTSATSVECAEVGAFAPGAWAGALAAVVEQARLVILPASPDGRDLAPRLAHALGRPLWAGALRATPAVVVLARWGGLVTEERALTGPAVVTLEPGVRGASPAGEVRARREIALGWAEGAAGAGGAGSSDAEVVEVIPADPRTVDLADAARILSGGAGLGGPGPFRVLDQVAGALGLTWGASRVAADLGWVDADRFIGTTGVSVHPELYIGLGISGAVQHVSGIGQPTHVVAVNTDASAPLMAMADLAIVTDAVALLDELAARLGA